eukprot:TRINITY_DN50163_c0_g1_i1.p1 TRINITY_DN50163_c0_g1~~TRINITY_DN50163_c0_g1_i1.p1  ORF type:complete len:244 (-),score=67.99 TRINITY_DN50163_c0_g1_i1:109-840(-)
MALRGSVLLIFSLLCTVYSSESLDSETCAQGDSCQDEASLLQSKSKAISQTELNWKAAFKKFSEGNDAEHKDVTAKPHVAAALDEEDWGRGRRRRTNAPPVPPVPPAAPPAPPAPPAAASASVGDACTAADNATIWASHPTEKDGEAAKATGGCAMSSVEFFMKFNLEKFSTCFTKEIAVSSACAGCYAQAAEFLFKNCLMACSNGIWCSHSCLDCGNQFAPQAQACVGSILQLPKPEQVYCD